VMCAIPFYWHLEAWNTGTCLYMAWTSLGCFIQCINSIIWNHNTINRAPIYSDIVVHFQAGLSVGIPAASLCIYRRLYKIATAKVVMATRSDNRRAAIIDLLIGIGHSNSPDGDGVPYFETSLRHIRRYWPLS